MPAREIAAQARVDAAFKQEYGEAGKYTVVVEVIDILGNDTTKTLSVEMK